MSLKLSSFGQYIVGGDQIDYLEIRQGEQYTVPIFIQNSLQQPEDLTSWNLTSVTYDVYTASVTYAGTQLSSVTNFAQQLNNQVDGQLTVITKDQTQPANVGKATLQIPAIITRLPAGIITADGDNTMVVVINIAASYPSSVAGFQNIRKLLLGLIVRFGD